VEEKLNKLDAVESIETDTGITWLYIKDNHVIDTVSWTWEKLYKGLVE